MVRREMPTAAERAQARDREERGVYVVHPNRSKPTVLATRAVVVLLLLASIGLMVIVTIGGWSTLEGAKAVQIGYIVVYVLLAIYALRWNRGVLPLSAALAIVLAIFALVAGPGWFNRDHSGYAAPNLPASLLGLLTLLIIPVQLLLIAFAMRGFSQGWNVEEERPRSSGASGDRDFGDAQPHPA
jgi:presenilin-like A22 family membrane protease